MNTMLWIISSEEEQVGRQNKLVEEIPAESWRWKNNFNQADSFGVLLADTQISHLDS